ncbi:hypothetical protein R1flu_027651 [Riccia fluitans]|uniref:Uncharacterized protein n=1 Tax=Riccia fluitans TaxID=41844 RepID=A0ABD1XK55_9MARC
MLMNFYRPNSLTLRVRLLMGCCALSTGEYQRRWSLHPFVNFQMIGLLCPKGPNCLLVLSLGPLSMLVLGASVVLQLALLPTLPTLLKTLSHRVALTLCLPRTLPQRVALTPRVLFENLKLALVFLLHEAPVPALIAMSCMQ